MARQTLGALQEQLDVARSERDVAVHEVTRLRAILAVLRAALAQAEVEDVR
jgi:hypothetical protein